MTIFAVFLVIVFILLSISKLKLHPFFALLAGSLILAFLTKMPADTIIPTFQEGFGSIMTNIGIIVILGSVLGALLESTGALKQIGQFIASKGRKDQTLPMNVLGSFVSISVFCDSAFIILSPLAKILSKLKYQSTQLLAVALASGLYASHCLVIPTPGPLAVATSLGLVESLGLTMLVGCLLLIPLSMISTFAAKWLFKNLPTSVSTFLHSNEVESEGNLPSFGRSLFPLLFPILLIAGGSILKIIGNESKTWQFICHPVMALFLAIIIGYFLLYDQLATIKNKWIESGISMAGPILAITAAGGVLGSVIKKSNVSDVMVSLISGNANNAVLIFLFGFIITALLKTTQGSSTTAMIIGASVLSPMLASAGIDTPVEIVLVMMSICGGAMAVSHINDSYFWVIHQFGDVPTNMLLRSFTVLSLVQGITVLLLSSTMFIIYQSL